MADFSALKQSIETYIKNNGNKEITGNILQNILLSMVITMGDQAINNVFQLLSNEVAERENADGLIRQALTVERQRAIAAETKSAVLDVETNTLVFKNAAGQELYQVSVASLVSNGLVDVEVDGTNLVMTFHTESGDKEITIPISDIFNPSNYYTKTQVDGLLLPITTAITNVSSRLNEGYIYLGVADPETIPTSATGKFFYIASQAGTYNFITNGDIPIVISSNGLYILSGGVEADDWYLETIAVFTNNVQFNNSQLITSGGVFNAILPINDLLRRNYILAGVADTTTIPTEDTNVFYLAGQGGIYTHFLNGDEDTLVLPKGLTVIYRGVEDDGWNYWTVYADNDFINTNRAQELSPAQKSLAQTNMDVYSKTETYNKTELDNLITTPNQEYVTVDAYASLPATGSADTIYRVSNYNGSTNQVDVTSYSEYAWNGSSYTFLCVKSQIGEVFDISVYNNNAKYADLAAALNGGANIPQSLQKGGMSIKFVSSVDNKYVQYRLMADSFNTTVANWQGVDEEPTAGSDNLVKSGGVKNDLNCLSIDSDRYVLENYYLNKFYNDQTGKLGDQNGFVMTPRLQYKKDAYIYFYSSTNYYLFSAICFDKNGTYLGFVPLGWQVDSYKWRATLGAITNYYPNVSYFNVCIWDNSSTTELTPSDISSFHFELVKQNNYKDSIADIYDVLGIRNILVKPDRGRFIAYDNGYYVQQEGYNLSSRGNINLQKGETVYVESNAATSVATIAIADSDPSVTLAYPVARGTGSKSVSSYTAKEDCIIIISYVESDGCRVFVTNNKKLEWQDKTWASYGDSIVQGNTWQDIVTEKLGFAKHYNRGIGGTSFIYGTAKYSLNQDGSYNDGGNTNMHYGYYASWDRITNMFPASIKDTIDLVVIGGGNNDINNYYMPENEIVFSSSATEDAEWISYCQANNLPVGDFGTTDYKNAIVSTIMKLQTWMPNAIIVCLSTIPTMGNNGTANQTSMVSVEVYGRTNTPIMLRDGFKKAADFVSTPFIDIYSKMGVNFLNRHDYVVDGIHPNANGGKMIARVVVGDLKNILPRL